MAEIPEMGYCSIECESEKTGLLPSQIELYHSGRGLAYITNAPKAYDGLGTYEGNAPEVRERFEQTKERFVVIAPEHLDWQLSRYWSGLYVTREAHR